MHGGQEKTGAVQGPVWFSMRIQRHLPASPPLLSLPVYVSKQTKSKLPQMHFTSSLFFLLVWTKAQFLAKITSRVFCGLGPGQGSKRSF
jgi:predicted metal-binding membrane protein